MPPIVVGSTNINAINAEIEKIDGRLNSIYDEIQFANDQLNGTAAVYLYSEAELSSKPYLEVEQKVLFPPTLGIIGKDRGFKNIILNTLQPIITPYEDERRALDGKYPAWNSTSTQIVILRNDNNGVSGNVTITDTITNPNFLIAGMQDGAVSRQARGAMKPTNGIDIISHEIITISDGTHAATIFEFYRATESVLPGRIGVLIVDSDSPSIIAGKLLALINGAPSLDVTANVTLFDLFDENMMQTSGVARLKPLFDPSLDFLNLTNPGEMFGGTASDASNEVSLLGTELAKIAYLITGYCQTQIGPPPPHIPSLCQIARNDLVTCLRTRYNPSTLLGVLSTEKTALLANPDTSSFPHDPLAPVQAEMVRIEAFLNYLSSGIPLADPLDPVILAGYATGATARTNFINTFRIPEMDANLQGVSGYYTSRYNLASFRLKGSGTAQEVLFWRSQIYNLGVEKTDLMTQRIFLESLLP